MAVIYTPKDKKNDNLFYYNFNNVSGVSVITCTNRPKHINHIFANFLSQSYDKKELVIVINKNNIDIKKYQKKIKNPNQIKVFQIDEKASLGECKRFAFNHINYDLVSFFDDDDFYGPNFLQDAVITIDNLNCDIVGKKCFYVYFENTKTLALSAFGKENMYVYHVADSSMVFKRKILENISYPTTPNLQDSEFQRFCYESGFKIYSAERFNYVVHRYPNPEESHDWKIKDKDFLKFCKIIDENIDDYSKYVIK